MTGEGEGCGGGSSGSGVNVLFRHRKRMYALVGDDMGGKPRLRHEH
jgi:hypothetical protein